jgi:hypothetical protein
MNNQHKEKQMNKWIKQAVALALVGLALTAGALAGDWQAVNFTSGTIGGVRTYYDADGAAKEDGILLFSSLTSNLDYEVQLSDDNGSNYWAVVRIHHDDVDNDYYPVVFPIAKGQLWRIQNSRLSILSMHFFAFGADDGSAARLSALEQAVALLNQEIGRLATGLDNLSALTAGEIAAIKSRLDAYDTTLAHVLRELAGLREKLAGLQDQAAADVAQLHERIDELALEIGGLRDGLNGKIAELAGYLKGMDSRLRSVEQKSGEHDDLVKAALGVGAAGAVSGWAYMLTDDDERCKQPEDCEPPQRQNRPGFAE